MTTLPTIIAAGGNLGNSESERSAPGVLRGTVNGKKKYCRIPIRSKMAGSLGDAVCGEGYKRIDANLILSLPREEAVRVIDGLVSDWMYWLKRANELLIRYNALRKNGEGENQC